VSMRLLLRFMLACYATSRRNAMRGQRPNYAFVMPDRVPG
jgi:hypothetical protein